jgi:hypothetical protein
MEDPFTGKALLSNSRVLRVAKNGVIITKSQNHRVNFSTQ